MSKSKPKVKQERTIDERITYQEAQITIQKEKLRRILERLNLLGKGLERLKAEKAYKPLSLPDLDSILD